jgi:PAS domain S-box-containing protein
MNSDSSASNEKSLRSAAEARLRDKLPRAAAAAPKDLQKLIHELQVHQVELELQNEQLRCTQEELEDARDKYVDLYDFSPCGYLVLDQNGKIFEANLTAARLLGVDREKLLRAKFSDFVVPECQDTAYLHWQKVFDRALAQQCELSLRRLDGPPVEVRLESIAMKSPVISVPHARVAVVDISDYQRATKTIRALNDSFEYRVDEKVKGIRMLADAVAGLGDGVLITDEHRRWSESEPTYVNKAMQDITGYREADLLGRFPKSILGFLANDQTIVVLENEISQHGVFQGELTFRRQDGAQRTGELFIKVIRDPESKRAHYFCVLRDITERKMAEVQLHDREFRLRALLNASRDAIITINANGVVVDCNDRMEEVFGYTNSKVIGENVSMLMANRELGKIEDYVRRSRGTETGYQLNLTLEMWGRHADGSSFPIAVSLSPVDDLDLFTGYMRDISELRTIQRAILRIPGEEQWRIGQALHDGPQQALAGLTLLSKGLAQDMAQDASPFTQDVENLHHRLATTSQQDRDLARGIVGVQIMAGGLIAMLENLGERTRQDSGMTCSVTVTRPLEIKENYIAEQLYYIACEAVTNALKHSQADHIDIFLERAASSLILKIRDNGATEDTLNEGLTTQHGLGIRIMEHRAATMGGNLRIYRSVHGCTVVHCTVPYTILALLPDKE